MTDAEAALEEDVVAQLGHDSHPLTEQEKTAVGQLLHDCVRFDEQPPPTAGLERVYIEKSEKWVPRSGKSVKAGNLRFNLGKLLEAGVSGAGTYFTSLVHPVFAIFTGIVVLRNLVKAATVDLTDDDAWVLWAIWDCEQRGKDCTVAAIQSSITEEATRVGSPTRMTLEEVQAGLDRLEKIRAARKGTDGMWEVIESVVVKT